MAKKANIIYIFSPENTLSPSPLPPPREGGGWGRGNFHYPLCRFIGMIVSFIFLLSACATAPVEKAKEALIPAEQDAKALAAFNEILSISQASDSRQAVLPQIEKIYNEIITKYPEASLAQESYWRLIAIYVNDYNPPAYEKAEALYNEFFKKYPESDLRGFIDETLGTSYYKNAEWDKLLKVCLPSYRKYIEEGKRPRPSLIFMYSEANFNLGNFTEAEKGYKIVIEMFPRLSESIKAKERLEEIKER